MLAVVVERVHVVTAADHAHQHAIARVRPRERVVGLRGQARHVGLGHRVGRVAAVDEPVVREVVAEPARVVDGLDALLLDEVVDLRVHLGEEEQVLVVVLRAGRVSGLIRRRASSSYAWPGVAG